MIHLFTITLSPTRTDGSIESDGIRNDAYVVNLNNNQITITTKTAMMMFWIQSKTFSNIFFTSIFLPISLQALVIVEDSFLYSSGVVLQIQKGSFRN